MNSEAPVNSGHAYANAAEEYEDRELWSKAIEAHQNAAEQFRKSLEYTQDAETGKSLRLLISNHTRKIKEHERKVAKLKSEQEQLEKQQRHLQQQEEQELPGQPKQQQQQTGTPVDIVYNQQSISDHLVGINNHNGLGKNDINMRGLSNALPGMTCQTTGNGLSLLGRIDKKKVNESSHNGSIGESYALLSTDNYDADDDASDPFNKFLRVVETLVDQLSNPVAFASAPLNEDDVPTPYQQKLLVADGPNSPPPDSDNDNIMDASAMMESFFFVPDNQGDTTLSSSNTFKDQDMETLQMQNEQLRRRVEQLSRQVQSLEKTAEERNMLKSSILQFRNDVQRQAKRIMQTHESTSMRSSSVALLGNSGINASATHNSYPRHPGMNQTTNGSTAELVTRLKDTEDENKRLKDQLDKQQVLMNKYRERWEKLKESAKKRRAQPADASNSSSNNPNNSINNNSLSDYQRPYSSRPPALLRSLAQQSSSAQYPPFASSSLAKSSRIASGDRHL
ncbi:hypothetical protein BCR42DRAFT_36585 [Absidia repens]|uniref:MIT domain-containing protein n=1 Tax=Absidia repens TaxID=90262 RepID=A0A1X2IH85_9FUNG|nr:hypothetical protein BCR42DRAFT_36585 [Absidia repens]